MAGLSSRPRYDPQPIPRQAPYSQHSSSVPSTPYQKPRDLSSNYSRSPSPRRNLNGHSPRSVVSETVSGANGTRRATTVALCKYETVDEYKKRRMPYIEGGDQELGRPKKEPRRTLEPDEQDKLSGDMRELYDRILPSPESEERRAKLVAKLHRILNERWPGNDIRVNVFGSSGNLLSSTDSDVDICITTPYKDLVSMHDLAELLHEHGMQNVVCRAAAKVPIVKYWDPELRLASDLNVNNTLALQNTRLIKTYVMLDDRVRPLAKIIKYWTKRRILNDAAFGATISSYTWICMIINFLQRRDPPILPSLQKIGGCRLATDDGSLSPFADDIAAIKTLDGFGSSNKESLGELLFQFFRHYGFEFEYSKYVVSVKEGRPLSRQEKGWASTNAREDKEARHRLCVEEPFTTHRNLGNTADEYAWHGIHEEIRRAFNLLDNGLELDKCCEEFVFPKEQKPVFQRPPPKPKPTLTRSASQSGQTTREPGSVRSRKSNRNQSSQRAGNRRASSGASYPNRLAQLPFSPPLGAPSSDYFHVKGNLHEQLYQQYQFLQAQQDALRSQLVQQQQQQQQQQAQPRAGDAASSPRPRQFSGTSGLSSPRLMDHPPQTAPIFPGYIYHYPTRYPLSPLPQARSREGTSTNPSSPLLAAAVPLRRQVHRTSVPDGSASTVRSQSQPGRSLPHPLTLQSNGQFDISGPFQSPRTVSHMYPGQPGVNMSLPAIPGLAHRAPTFENAMPKEYVGYYVGQSPQLGPQPFTTANTQMAPPPMSLKDPPARQRRVTPDLMPPLTNGRHSSRSPSPLGHSRSLSLAAEQLESQPTLVQSPSAFDQPVVPIISIPAPTWTSPELDLGGPIIVNGSNRNHTPKAELTNGMQRQEIPHHMERQLSVKSEDLARLKSLALQTNFDKPDAGQVEVIGRRPSSPKLSPTTMVPADGRFTSPSSLEGTPQRSNGINGRYHDEGQHLGQPLLSPVAELRTPSPTHSRGFGMYESPEEKVNSIKAAKIADAKQIEREFKENLPARSDSGQDERRRSAPLPTGSRSATAPKGLQAQQAQGLPNNWQQVSKKGHKKNKSATVRPTTNGSNGQPMPTNEAERKGG